MISKPAIGVALGVLVIASLFAVQKVFASEREKDTIVFLTGETCKEQAWLQERLPDYSVICAYKTGSFQTEPNVAWARMHYSTFESEFYVIYVQSEYYQLTPTVSVAGISFWHYAIAIGADYVVEHERLHLVCQCHKTPDGHHG